MYKRFLLLLILALLISASCRAVEFSDVKIAIFPVASDVGYLFTLSGSDYILNVHYGRRFFDMEKTFGNTEIDFSNYLKDIKYNLEKKLNSAEVDEIKYFVNNILKLKSFNKTQFSFNAWNIQIELEGETYLFSRFAIDGSGMIAEKFGRFLNRLFELSPLEIVTNQGTSVSSPKLKE